MNSTVRVPAKHAIFEPFIYENDHFAKTGSGQLRGKTQKKDGVIRTEDAHTVDSNPLIAEHLSKVKVIRNRPLRKTVVFFECFPYVCPEPVLVK
eukprot:COSAG06_NODE_753_length_12547_cov_928.116244_10_plen_94_part_00